MVAAVVLLEAVAAAACPPVSLMHRAPLPPAAVLARLLALIQENKTEVKKQ